MYHSTVLTSSVVSRIFRSFGNSQFSKLWQPSGVGAGLAALPGGGRSTAYIIAWEKWCKVAIRDSHRQAIADAWCKLAIRDSHRQAIADARFCDDEFRAVRISLQFFSNLPQVDAQILHMLHGIGAPDFT